MYMMAGINVDELDVEDDVEFCKAMWAEQSVRCTFLLEMQVTHRLPQVHLLPGSCFGAENFFRVVICPPKDVLVEAWSRIAEFMKSHVVNPAKKQKA